MSDTPKTIYAQAALTEAELDEVLRASRGLVMFPGEMAGLAIILDQIAEDHPDAAGDLAKVARAIRTGAVFAQGCNQRISETWMRKGSLLSPSKGGVQ